MADKKYGLQKFHIDKHYFAWFLVVACAFGGREVMASSVIHRHTTEQQTMAKQNREGETEASPQQLLKQALQCRAEHPGLFAGGQGILVLQTVPGSQAHQAGLQPGDILIRYAGYPLDSKAGLRELVETFSTRPAIALEFIRGDKLETVELTGGGLGVQVIGITRPSAQEVFLQAFVTALEAEDWESVEGLLQSDPELALQVQHSLEQTPGESEEAQLRRDLGKLLGQSLQAIREDADIAELDQLQHLGAEAYYQSDYPSALRYWEQALAQAHELDHARYTAQFSSNIGSVYEALGQSAQALTHYQAALAIYQQTGHAGGEAAALTNIGVVYKNLSQYEKALEYYEKPLAIYRARDDRAGESAVLSNIGVIYRNLAQYHKALDYYHQALALDREIHDRSGESSRLTNIGVVYADLGQYAKALDYYQQALALDGETHDRRGESGNLTNIGVVYAATGHYSQALEYYQDSLAIRQKIGDRTGESASFTNIGLIYFNLDQYSKALEYYEQALTIDRDLGHRMGEGVVLGNLGLVYSRLHQYPKALAYYEQALALQQEIGDRRGEGRALDKIGELYEQRAQYSQASDYFAQALAITREIGDRTGESAVLSNIGGVYNTLGQYAEALEYQQQALAIARETGDRSGEASDLGNIGVVYENLGRYADSLDYQQQALAIEREIGDRRGESAALSNLGGVYWRLGQYAQALQSYQDALTITRQINNRKGESIDLSNLGGVYWGWGQYAEAVKYYEQALVINREIGDRSSEAANLVNLGVMYDHLGQYDQALKYLEQALALYQEMGEVSGKSAALTNIGMVYSNLGQDTKALENYQQALVLHRKPGNQDDLWKSQRGLAATQARMHHTNAAIRHYLEALDTLESLRGGLDKSQQKLSYFEDKLYVYDELIQVLHRQAPQHALPAEASRQSLAVFERRQGRVFLEQIGASGARQFAGIPESVIQREVAIGLQMTGIQKQLTTEYAKFIGEQNADTVKSLQQQLQTLQTEEQTLRHTIQMNHAGYHALRHPKPVDLPELQNRVLQPNELVMIYHVVPEVKEAAIQDMILLWVISKDDFASFALSLKSTVLEQRVTALYRVLAARGDKVLQARGRKLIHDPALGEVIPWQTAAHALYQDLIPASVRSALKGKTLYVVPTGVLYTLPFEALVTENDDKPRYLIEDTAVSYLSSASLLKILRDARARRKAEPEYPLLAFANPVYDGDVKPDGERDLFAAALDEQFRNAGLTPLPETEAEARAIAQVLEAPAQSKTGIKTLQLQGDARRPRVFDFNDKKYLDDYRYLLFAMHGVFTKVDKLTQPALALSYPDSDGYLTMADIFGLQLNADFIMLSACNTGSGDPAGAGEGIRGLTGAFMYAGTPAVAVTLWSVETHSAKALSTEIFRQLKSGLPVAEALRAAKLKLLRGESEGGEAWRHPFFWAAFTGFGDGR